MDTYFVFYLEIKYIYSRRFDTKLRVIIKQPYYFDSGNNDCSGNSECSGPAACRPLLRVAGVGGGLGDLRGELVLLVGAQVRVRHEVQRVRVPPGTAAHEVQADLGERERYMYI